MNLIDAKIQSYSKAKYLHIIVSIWWLFIKLNFCTLTPWCQRVNPGAGDWEDVFILSVKCWDQRKFLELEYFHREELQFFTDPSLIYYAATLLSFWIKQTHTKLRLEELSTCSCCTAIVLEYYSHLMKLTDLPCIQNQRNPGLLCHLWIHLWSQEEHPGVARRSLCLPVFLGLRGDPWSLGRGNPPSLGCAWGGCRTSRRSSVSPPPR